MSLNFEMKDKFLTKLEITDMIFIKTLTYLTALSALIIAIMSAFGAGTPSTSSSQQSTPAEVATRSLALHQMYYSVFLFFFVLIFLFMADWFSKKYGFVQWKKMILFLVLILVIYPFVVMNAFPSSLDMPFVVTGVLIGLFHILVVIINYRHEYVQEYLAKRKEIQKNV